MLERALGLVVVATCELPDMAVPVLGAHGRAGATDTALEQGPKRLDAVGVHRAAPVLVLAVVDAGMTVVGQASVGGGLVGAGPGTGFQVFPYEGLQGGLPLVGHHRHPDGTG